MRLRRNDILTSFLQKIVSLQKNFPGKEVQRKKKYSIVKSNDEPLAQERRRMQSCSPPQMLAERHPPSPTRSNASVAPQGEGAAALRQ